MARKEKFEFTADQIGSEVLARFSEDIYSPKAIVRELAKNAYDSYAQLAHAFPNSGYDNLDREVKIDVVGNTVIVSDEGLGLDIPNLKLLISIALTEKRDIEGATGFRGIGFWSAYTGGDTIVVESTRLDCDRLYRLTLNTRRMRELQGPDTSIGAIMNEAKCMELESDSANKEDHFTKVLVRAESADGRLYNLIHDPDLMRKIILEGCSCRLAEGTRHADHISAFYDTHDIRPAHLLYQGKELFRDVPPDAGEFLTGPVEVEIDTKKQSIAWVWHATNTKNAALDTPFAGIRVFRDSFPIGLPNLYSHRKYHDSQVEVTRQDLLVWHVGEVHLLHDLLRPDAGGENVRDNILFNAFRERLRAFYEETLVPISRSKQLKASLRKEYHGYLNQLNVLKQKVARHQSLGEDEKKAIQEVAAKIERHNTQAKGRPKSDAGPASQEIVVRDSQIKNQRKQITEILHELKDAAGVALERPAKNEDKKPAKTKGAKGQPARPAGNDSIPAESAFAVFDEIRDAIIEILSDDPALRDELLDRINDAVKRLLS